MAKKNTPIEEPAVEETAVVEKPWDGYPSRDFFTPIDGVENNRLTEETVQEETPAEDGGQE